MAVLAELSQVKSAHTVLNIANVFSTTFERLRSFAPQLHFTSFCTENSHLYKLLFYQQFSIIFKRQRLHLKEDCCSDFTALTSSLDTCCSLLSEHRAQHLSNLVLGEQNIAYNTTYCRGFKQRWLNKSTCHKIWTCFWKYFCWYVAMFKLESICVSLFSKSSNYSIKYA